MITEQKSVTWHVSYPTSDYCAASKRDTHRVKTVFYIIVILSTVSTNNKEAMHSKKKRGLKKSYNSTLVSHLGVSISKGNAVKLHSSQLNKRIAIFQHARKLLHSRASLVTAAKKRTQERSCSCTRLATVHAATEFVHNSSRRAMSNLEQQLWAFST